jgi:hypothetical protein
MVMQAAKGRLMAGGPGTASSLSDIDDALPEAEFVKAIITYR